MMILIWIIIGLGIYYFMRNNSFNNDNSCCSTSKNKKTPEEILKERFINGEIDEETYLKMKDTLNK